MLGPVMKFRFIHRDGLYEFKLTGSTHRPQARSPLLPTEVSANTPKELRFRNGMGGDYDSSKCRDSHTEHSSLLLFYVHCPNIVAV